MEFKDLSEQDKITAHVAQMSLESLPKSHSEFGSKIWDAFNLGRKWGELDKRHLTSRQSRAAGPCVHWKSCLRYKPAPA